MYWQVYLHKTVLVAEYTIVNVLKRAKELRMKGVELFATPALDYFLSKSISIVDFENNEDVINWFSELDDYDIATSMKVWISHDDFILSYLCNSVINRRLFKIELQNEPFQPDYVQKIRSAVKKEFDLAEDEVDYFLINESTSNYTYKPGTNKIGILQKDDSVIDIAEASDQLNISSLNKPTTKYFLSYPKSIIN